ncbi:glycosyltransferase family 2 protein [Cerasicoccus fimbriatus]|uniref:glycosyltransferase family 2 protein n=1 Tax=Cerasicoccus fimbriatus TaxID=3014554 RepID=UPI0022B3F681|nr:glycosyltransferase family A protein [Cerasicoccus sp. TK19100]
MRPLVSIIIPAYNAGQWIKTTLESAIQQSYEHIEIIVIDDGSKDDTAAIVKTFDDKRIKLIEQSNAGQSAAANRGIAESAGQYLKFLDADDALSPNHIHAQLAAIESDSNAIADCSWGYFVNDWQSARPRIESTNQDYENPMDWLVESLTKNEGMMGGWKWLIHKAVIERAGGWNSKLSLNNDFDFSIRLLLASSGVRHAPEALYAYRKAETASLSGSRGRKAMESAWLTTKLGCDNLIERECSERIRKICADRHQMWLFQFFPEFADLAKQAESEVARFGGSNLQMQGGRALGILLPILGWKNVRRLQQLAYSSGWSQVLAWKQSKRIQQLEPKSLRSSDR